MTTKKTDNPNEMVVLETSKGEVHLLPFTRLPTKVFRKNRDLDEMSQMFGIIEAGTDEDGLEVIDELTLEELGKLFEDWSEQQDVTPGK